MIDGKIDQATGNNVIDLIEYIYGKKPDNREVVFGISGKANESANIDLLDIIGGWGISSKQIADKLKALGAVKTINIQINSPGGDVFEGISIHNLLIRHPAKIIVNVIGEASSIASVIAMAGDEIRMADNALMMIHKAWARVSGDDEAHYKMGDLLKSVTNTLTNVYVKRTKSAYNDVQTWMKNTTYMTAAEAVDRGFADSIDEGQYQIAAFAAMPRPREIFGNIPAALSPKRMQAAKLMQRIRGQAI